MYPLLNRTESLWIPIPPRTGLKDVLFVDEAMRRSQVFQEVINAIKPQIPLEARLSLPQHLSVELSTIREAWIQRCHAFRNFSNFQHPQKRKAGGKKKIQISMFWWFLTCHF